jgi:hypothetical protein
MIMRRMITIGFVTAGLALTCGATFAAANITDTHHTKVSPVVAPVRRAASCPAAPTTAAGYTAMFAKLNPAQWGGGDVSISVKLGTRTVWLYGDTLSTGRMVHSTAIVQTGGCLHVSHGGTQLLPNSGSSWYWIAAANAYGRSSVRILATSVHRTGSGPWDFATGRSRYAVAAVSAAGDVTFTRWLPGTVATPKPSGTLVRVGPGHVEYGQVVHRDIPLADGRYLRTLCQNWDDGRMHAPRAYAPLFSTA